LLPVSTDTAVPSEASEQQQQARAWDAAHVMKTYARQPVTFVRGQGARLWDADGREYLDFLAGIAVCAVGHCHPRLVRAIQEQAATLMHVSNLYLTQEQARLARRLVELSDFERVFFCNSGAEANEAAIKIARKRAKQVGGARKVEIVTALNSFHGRTIATVTATGQPRYQKGFEPLPGGFTYVPFNDENALGDAVGPDTAAILLEPIQGESGVVPARAEYLRAARALADRHGALLIFDEVQTGMGRTGRMWAYQNYGVAPDVLTSAKGLGGGFPIGACLARGAAAETFVPGDHGSTFAGSPLAARAANAVLDILADEDLQARARDLGARLSAGLKDLGARYPHTVGDPRGMGLMLALGLKRPVARQITASCLQNGLIVNAVGDETIRLLPPLVITAGDVDLAVEILNNAIASAS
jgi:predicted acetylornithine/succinylornithine family transaminase